LIVEADPTGKTQSRETTQRRTKTKEKWHCWIFGTDVIASLSASPGSEAPSYPLNARHLEDNTGTQGSV